MSPNDLVTEGHFVYKGYLSKETEPTFHLLDVNAPLSRRKSLATLPSSQPS